MIVFNKSKSHKSKTNKSKTTKLASPNRHNIPNFELGEGRRKKKHYKDALKNISTSDILATIYSKLVPKKLSNQVSNQVFNTYKNSPVPLNALLDVLQTRDIFDSPENDFFIDAILLYYDEHPTIYSTDPVLYDAYNVFATIVTHQLNTANRD